MVLNSKSSTHLNGSSTDQENLKVFISENKNNININNNNNNNNTTGTPVSKQIVVGERRILSEKTPLRNNSTTTTLKVLKGENNENSNLRGQSKRPFSNSPLPSVATTTRANDKISTLIHHPILKEIISNSTVSPLNAVDTFLQPEPQKKRRNLNLLPHTSLSLVRNDEDVIENENSLKTRSTKLITVFPTTSDDLDLDEIELFSPNSSSNDTTNIQAESEREAEIEHPAGGDLFNDDDDDFDEDSIHRLVGTSKIIPNLNFSENIDFTPLVKSIHEHEHLQKEQEDLDKNVNNRIDVIYVDFNIQADDDGIESNKI